MSPLKELHSLTFHFRTSWDCLDGVPSARTSGVRRLSGKLETEEVAYIFADNMGTALREVHVSRFETWPRVATFSVLRTGDPADHVSVQASGSKIMWF